MRTETHAPTPWRIAHPEEYPWRLGQFGQDGEPTFTILGDDGWGVLSVPHSVVRELRGGDVAFMIRAVNCHDELVDVLNPIVDQLPAGYNYTDGSYIDLEDELTVTMTAAEAFAVRTALANAKGEAAP